MFIIVFRVLFVFRVLRTLLISAHEPPGMALFGGAFIVGALGLRP